MAIEDQTSFEYCESCGIQMKEEGDHGGKDLDNKWCKECCNEKGEHKSKEEIKKIVVKLIMGPEAYPSMGEMVTDPEEAGKMAEEYMKKMPAWEVKEKEEDS